MTLLAVLDCLLALGLTLRLTRLVVMDDLSLWWLRGPLAVWATRKNPLPEMDTLPTGFQEMRVYVPDWRGKLVSGLSCPFCVGFWIGCLVLLSLWLVGGPGAAAEPWRWVAGAFTLNWVAAHIGARAGDSGYDEE